MFSPQQEVVLDGELSLNLNIDGDLSLDLHMDGEAGTVIKVSDYAYPLYTGSIEVTPSAETQILPTINRTVTDNIIINPIPSNYGLITWNGSTLTVS
jgi:hypothetical protein